MSASTMTCAMCGKTKAWPDGFPSTLMAECWECFWKKHIREDHPNWVRKVRRRVKKTVRALYRQKVEQDVEEELIRGGWKEKPTNV